METCSMCTAKFQRSNKHTSDICDLISSLSLNSWLDAKECHGFIRDGLISCSLVSSQNIAVELDGGLNSIFLHPDAASQINLEFGQPVWVCPSASTLFIARYLPSKKVEMFGCALSKKLLYRMPAQGSQPMKGRTLDGGKQRALVRKVEGHAEAYNVSLYCEQKKSHLTDSVFCSFLKAELQKLGYVFVGQRIRIVYFGQVMDFCVTRISDSHGRSFGTIPDQYLGSPGLNNEFWTQGLQGNYVGHITDRTSIAIAHEMNPMCADDAGLDLRTCFRDISPILETVIMSPVKRKANGTSLLLYGVSGVGKSYLCQMLKKELGGFATTFSIGDLDLCQNELTDREGLLMNTLREAQQSQPALIIVDNLDVLISVEEKDGGGKHLELILSHCLDSVQTSSLFMLCAIDDPSKLKLSLRRRFMVELEVSVPNTTQRGVCLKHIIKKIINSPISGLSDADIDRIASTTHGYTPADLTTLCNHAVLCAGSGKALELRYLEASRNVTRPSAMKEIILEVPTVRWTDIGGLNEVKLSLQEVTEWPLRHCKEFEKLGIKSFKGVLLYGPPGCCKTMLARAVATESVLNLFAVKGPELFSKWVGESERAVRELFRKARLAAPSLIFLDEIECLAASRTPSSSTSVGDRVLAQLLTEMDGLEPLNHVIVIAATNRPDFVDPALLRRGRFDRLIYVPLPDGETREEILKVQLRRIPLRQAQENMSRLVEMTDGYSGAEVVGACQEAAMLALKRKDMAAHEVEMVDFEKALQEMKPRTDAKMLNLLLEFKREH